MGKSIALLRGINVVGHKKFPKAEQLEMLSILGFKNPKYIFIPVIGFLNLMKKQQ